MGQSLSKLYIHIIFSTKKRQPLLTREVRRELYPYLATLLTDLACQPIIVGGMLDHIHILCSLPKSHKLEDLLERVKSQTSRWLKQKFPALLNFKWQAGYGAFSVSASNIEKVRRYIENQEEHHRVKTFEEELREFLTNYQIEYDERYVWD